MGSKEGKGLSFLPLLQAIVVLIGLGTSETNYFLHLFRVFILFYFLQNLLALLHCTEGWDCDLGFGA